MPDYNPPPPPNAEAEEDEELATPDRPRNRIIRLPQVIVEGERPPVFTEREVYTRRGLAELAMNRYLSELDRGVLNRYTLPLFGSSQEARAMEEYRARERLRNMAETDERIAVLRDTDPAAAERLQNAAHDTFIRSPNYVVPASLARD